MITVADIRWLAGYLEGEGCFTFTGDKYRYPRIVVESTDEDVIQRVSQLWGMKPHSVQHGSHKTGYSVATTCTKAVSWMMTLYPLMGQRRQARIREILMNWRNK